MTKGIYGDVNHEVLKALNSLIKVAYDDGFEDGKKAKFTVEARSAALERIKSPNQQRAELIQRAREFVEEFNKTKYSYYRIKFVINAAKRTIVALGIRNSDNRVIRKGIAKCHPDEVFNADIGKAIALARALEIDVPQKFMQAVQPTEAVRGTIVGACENVAALVNEFLDETNIDMFNAYFKKHGIIIDDTDAKYEEESK